MLNYYKVKAQKFCQTFVSGEFQVLLIFSFFSLKYKFEFHKDEEFVLRIYYSLLIIRKDVKEVDGYYSEHFVTQHDLLRDLAIHQSSSDPIGQRKRLIVEFSGDDLPKWWKEQKEKPTNARLLSISTGLTLCLLKTWLQFSFRL